MAYVEVKGYMVLVLTCMESLCIIASPIPRWVCISCGEVRVNSCVPFQYKVFCGYGLLAIVAVMNTIMPLDFLKCLTVDCFALK